VVGSKPGNSNHSKTSILEFLRLHLLLLLGIRWPKLEVINSRLGTSQEGLSVHLLLVFPRFEDSADDDPLGPPLGRGLPDGIDGVKCGHIVGGEGSEDLGEEPSDGGEHGGAAVGEFGSAGPVGRDVVAEAEGVELRINKNNSVRSDESDKLSHKIMSPGSRDRTDQVDVLWRIDE